MLEVTEKANEMIKGFLQGKDLQSIRIIMTSGCGGPNLGMALDEPKETDEVIKDNGLTFLIDKTLYEDAQPIRVDFIDSEMGAGFKLSSSLAAAEGGCGGCGGSCSS
jgi:iron-sulfur cluster assembly protein